MPIQSCSRRVLPVMQRMFRQRPSTIIAKRRCTKRLRFIVFCQIDVEQPPQAIWLCVTRRLCVPDAAEDQCHNLQAKSHGLPASLRMIYTRLCNADRASSEGESVNASLAASVHAAGSGADVTVAASSPPPLNARALLRMASPLTLYAGRHELADPTRPKGKDG